MDLEGFFREALDSGRAARRKPAGAAFRTGGLTPRRSMGCTGRLTPRRSPRPHSGLDTRPPASYRPPLQSSVCARRCDAVRCGARPVRYAIVRGRSHELVAFRTTCGRPSAWRPGGAGGGAARPGRLHRPAAADPPPVRRGERGRALRPQDRRRRDHGRQRRPRAARAASAWSSASKAPAASRPPTTTAPCSKSS